MKPFYDEIYRQRSLRPEMRCRLSLLGGGGGGGLAANTQASGGTTSSGGGGITINNGGGGPSSKTWLIIAGIGLSVLLVIGLFFREK